MQVTTTKLAETKRKLVVRADASELNEAKSAAVKKLGSSAKLAGFRTGKAPARLVEKNLDQNALQTEVLDSLINQLYIEAVNQNKLRVVGRPEVSITKFVPFTQLDFAAEVEVIGDVKLTNYKLLKLEKPKATVSAKDVNDVLDNLNHQNAGRKDASRAAKTGDEVTLDFVGRDAGTNQKINGADGKDYPLLLGSDQFIPGFEKELVGMKAGDEKEFTLTFPTDYAVSSLRGKKVVFDVTVKKVVGLELAKIDDAWAAKISPFKNLSELKADIKRQVTAEKQRGLDQQYQRDLLGKI
ncbi:MAG: trigger factor, partial [Candidatus Saccharimonadales bacterium]